MKTPRQWIITGAILAALAVVFGAFGAHRLPDTLKNVYGDQQKEIAGLAVPATYKYLQDFKTGVRYHMWHALALLGIGALMLRAPSRLLSAAAWCFVGGIILFSGALYVLVILGPKFGGITWGLVAPIGGTLQLIGWILLFIACLRLSSRPESPAHVTN